MRGYGPLRCMDIVLNSSGFDADWYTQRYEDARALDLSAEAHFARIGYWLGRGVSAAVPELSHDPVLQAALSRAPRISYCTPVMNRGEDIRATLETNLTENRDLSDKLEFVIVFMDDDVETQTWMRSHFADDLRTGYLRLIVEPPLDGWHFGKAKNRHRAYAWGDIYSSVDGDNFVTLEETQQLLAVAEAQKDHFAFHHFTGVWGDGSSGRVSLPMSMYRALGYDEQFMPRQYDEMDLLLSALCTYKDLPLVRMRSATHGFSAPRSQQFLAQSGLDLTVIELDPPRRRMPINPKTEDYVQADRSMEAMTTFNQGLSFLKNAVDDTARAKYLRLAVDGRHQVIDALAPDAICKTLFHDAPDVQIEPQAHAVSLFACMKNDDGFLPGFYDHYRALGVQSFFIVDDGSDTPIRETLPHENVHVFRPKTGTFVTSKGMWLDGLMKAFLRPGDWALTVDADEFLDLPAAHKSLPDLVAALEAREQDMMPALLVDMVPRADAGADALKEAETTFQTLFEHYVYATDDLSDSYAVAPSITWGFGPYARLSWHLDTRFHAFGTLDALRKIPLFRVAPGRHINQGFHTLHHTSETADPGHEIWDTDMVLPIRHYKLLKLFSEAARGRMAAHVADAAASPYHPRTTENIARIFGSDTGEQAAKVLRLPQRPYADGVLQALAPRDFYAVQDEDQSH